MTMNPVYIDVSTQLQAGLIGNIGTDIFGGEWGDTDQQILVIDAPGFSSELKDLYEHPGVQILVRGAKRQADNEVYAVAKEISDYLLSLPDCIDINGTAYTGFEPSSNIAALGKDKNERFVYSMNFLTYRNAF